MSNFSLPRARRAAEGRLLAVLRIRLISALTRRLTRIWLALTDTTSAETTEISEVTSLNILDVGGDLGEARGEALAELVHLGLGLGTGSTEVLHGLGEASISESSLLGERVVEGVGGSGEHGVSAGTVGSETLVHLVELVVGVLLGKSNIATESREGAGHAHAVLRLEAAESGGSTLLLGRDLVEDGSGGSLQLGSGLAGIAGHAGSIGSHTHVGLLDLLGSLGTEGELGTGLGSDSARDHTSNTTLVASKLQEKSLASKSRAGLGASGALHEVHHAALASGDGKTEILLGNRGSGADSVEHLLLKLSASSLGLEGDSLEGGVGLLGEAGHLSLQAEGEGGLGLADHALTGLEDGISTLLTLLDGRAEGRLKLSLVGLLEGGDELAARAGAGLVGADNTSQLGDGLVSLLVVLGNNLAELEHLAAESGLGVTSAVHHVEAHTTGGSLHGSVLLELGSLLASQSAVQTRSGLAEGALGVLAVALELTTDLGELGVEGGSDLVQATAGGGLVLVDETLELTVVLEVGLVTLVTETNHTRHLSVHVGIDLSLGGAVGAHNTSCGVDAGSDLLHLLLDNRGKAEDTDLELLLGSSNTTAGLLAGSLDVGDGFGVTAVLKSTGGIEGSGETGGGMLHGHVDLVALLGHGDVHTVERGSSGSNEGRDAVVSPGTLSLILGTELGTELALRVLGGTLEAVHLVVPMTHGLLEVLLGLLGVLLNLGGVGSNVTVHLVDAGVGSGSPGSGRTLPGGHGQAEVASSLAAVTVDHRDGLLVALHGGPPAAVGKTSLLGELLLGPAHGSVEVVTAGLGVDSHLVEHVPLELGTCSSIESKVTGHLGTDRGNISATVGELRSNPALNTVEVVHQTHAARWGLGVDLPSLEDISGVHGGTGILSLNNLQNGLLCPIGGDVHHHQACHSETAENSTH